MIHVERMNAVALKVGDLQRSMEWYRGHFGFEHRYEAEGCVVIGVRDVELVLSPHDNPDAPLADPKEVRCIHTLGFEVSEPEFQKAWKEFSLDDGMAAFDQDEFRSIITADPDGYCVEIYCRRQPDQLAAGDD